MKPSPQPIMILLVVIGLIALAACGTTQPDSTTKNHHTNPVSADHLTGFYGQRRPEARLQATSVASLTPAAGFGPILGTKPTQPPLPPQEPSSTHPTGTPTATLPPPLGEAFGPIVGPDYTPVPTRTHIAPTALPTVIPTAGPSPTPGLGLRRDLMGIQIHPQIESREFADVLVRTDELGVGWIKFQYNWSLLESAPGHYTELLAILNDYVRRSHDAGVKTMISVAKAPGWSRTPDSDGVMRENGPPDDPQALANFLAGMLTLLGRNAQGRPYVDAVEVWNEPNLRREWYGYPMTGSTYLRYFAPAFTAIRAFSPQITIITAAPAPTGDSEESTDDRLWLQQLYGAGLARYGSDIAVGVHPYGWGNAPDARCCNTPSRGWDNQPQFFFLETIEAYRGIMVTFGHADAQLWPTEFGWATFDGLKSNGGTQPIPPDDSAYFGFIDQGQQAAYNLQAFEIGQSLPYLGPMILWNLNFSTIEGAVDRGDLKTGYSLVDNHWQPRPAYLALRQAPKQ